MKVEDVYTFLRNKSDKKVIKIINKNKVSIDLNKLLVASINCRRKELIKYLLTKNIDVNYKEDDFGYNTPLNMAILRGDIEVIQLLKNNKVDFYQEIIDNKKKYYPISMTRDIKTIKYLENIYSKKEIIPSLENIAFETIFLIDIELLEYLIKNYNLDIKKIKYDTPSKSYTFLEKTKEMLTYYENKTKEIRKYVFFIEEVFYQKRYRNNIKKSYELLNDYENKEKLLKKYYNYILKIYNENLK